ncbi:MAG TPA: aminotransferase class I/II-fold pyridoxal phosphate-dependent enzyme [Bacteroidales bacterium]|nr:aminotransferase class I/II-fold pyridoxal phosphate-dependent enzyme [Bacteroidales bacterium]HNR42534.1 aminotransferase class I/II-fold pyridoxal phosphate-dependent enzyme [Bacteroidales bacterium]HPM18497.1 aminotransferase class I/II-fold pyridoxal phosphate-dependent enzyme [Bacteroidales bacterium]HPM18506.1 aminotransferase class I/II-fold pyridoxal phosphate-dependent enzyme [Bacteroidales bacterium]
MKVEPADRTLLVEEYYFSRKLKQIEEMRKGGADVINLGIGSPDQPPSAGTIERLTAEAAKPNVHGYQSYTGIPALRKAFADWYMRYFGIRLDPEGEILPLIGSKEGIMHITMAFVNPGDEVLVPDPGYPTYSSATSLAGGRVRYYDLTEENRWLPDLDLLEKSDLSRTKIMWINYPHMPTGAKASAGKLSEMVSFASSHGILLCNDNPYSFILNTEYMSVLSAENAMDTAIELNSLSKSHNMAGWRIGMAAGNREYINTILKVKSNMDSGMFMPMQMAAVAALSNPDSWYEGLNSLYLSRRKIAESILEILGCTFDTDQAGLFLWGRIPDDAVSAEDLSEKILTEAHVFITPGFIFGKNGRRYIRISLCAGEDRLSEARDRLTSAKHGHSHSTLLS